MELRDVKVLRLAVLLGAVACAVPRGGRAEPGDLLDIIPVTFPGPTDIAYDSVDGTYWVTSALDYVVYHFSGDLREDLGTVPVPFENPIASFSVGIAFNSIEETLFVVDGFGKWVHEMARDGTHTGRKFKIPLEAGGSATGLGFNPAGDAGNGSLLVVGTEGPLIIEVALDGRLLRSFPDLEDPERFLGEGYRFGLRDVSAVVEGGVLVGVAAVGSANDGSGRNQPMVAGLDAEGRFTGEFVSLASAGGGVSSVVERAIQLPGAGEPVEAFICAQDTEGRIAIVEAGKPSFQPVIDLSCARDGRAVRLEWTSSQVYDMQEIVRGCEVLAVLEGDRRGWDGELPPEGVHELSLRVTAGGESFETKACTFVTGPGEVLAEVDLDARLSGGIALVGGHRLLAVTSDVRQQLLELDLDLEPIREIPLSSFFVGEGDVVTDLTEGDEPETIFAFNQTQFHVGKLDLDGNWLSDFEPLLPNLESEPGAEPDRGYVRSILSWREGNGGRGSLLLLEVVRGYIYEVNLSGVVLREFPHPYLPLDPRPEGEYWGAGATGMSFVEGGQPGEIFLTGSTVRDHGQPRLFRFLLESEEMVSGSAVPMDAVPGSGGFQHLMRGDSSRLVFVTRGSEPALVEIDAARSEVAAPTFFTGAVRPDGRGVALSFTPNGPYDQVEVWRDCERIAAVGGTASEVLDAGAADGRHEYTVRGLRGATAGRPARALVRTGPGAVLDRGFTWPLISAQQMARDPHDGSYYVAGPDRDDVRNVFLFDKDFVYQSDWTISVDIPWEIASLAVRVTPEDERLLCYILREGEDSTSYAFASERLDGSPVYFTRIDPPLRPGFTVSQPVGLTWSPASDTFFYLEGHSDTIVELDAAGGELRTFPHPAAPQSRFVQHTGLCFSEELGALLATTVSSPTESSVSRLVEIRVDGTLGDLEIPLDGVGTIRDVTLWRGELTVLTRRSSGLPGDFVLLETESRAPGTFIRGDADGISEVEMGDPIFTLDYLFTGGREISCMDAADTNDDGAVDLTDAVYTLRHLFQGGAAPPPPYPGAGSDPTADTLGCRLSRTD